MGRSGGFYTGIKHKYYIGYSVRLIAMERRKNAGQVFFNLRLLAFYSNVIHYTSE